MQGYFFLVFVVILGVLMMQILLRRQQEDELRHTGIRIVATVTTLVHDRLQTSPEATDAPGTVFLFASGATPPHTDHWYIECAWTEPRTAATYTFRSDSVDEATARAYSPGSPITVLMLHDDPDIYYVEVGS
jgi:hypothetical protein